MKRLSGIFKHALGIIFCLSLIMLNFPVTAIAADNIIYVSGSSGNDSNTGAYDAPVATIEKALELVEEKLV